MIPLSHYLILAAIIFSISIAGVVINRKSLITLLMCVELLLLAVNMNFIALSQYLHQLSGQIFVFFILAVAAAESAIGLAILVVIYRQRGNIRVDKLNELKG
ncbi:MAG: NADH-quinone oxidoreductase subunit NuoK [Legionellales bacterium]|nr:NADH-quinone oxidoreductase subunit NuoK [Legionellales bacterium]HAG61940.1 NADH-quinone oxidoreductase subunit NuoK [Coxiellaceae bacterium]|tara:strand:- start:8 stop:313 length:306 start_codon:yes stop_codon:yes gene_type:complete